MNALRFLRGMAGFYGWAFSELLYEARKVAESRRIQR